MKRCSLAVITLLLTLSLSGCGILEFMGLITKQAATNTYRTYVPESVTTVEEIQTADGQSVVVRVTSKHYLDRYVYSLESEGYPEWVFESEFRVSSDGRELPIAFDVAVKTPWIVLPVKSNQCARFEFPREGLVFFKLEGKSWKEAPYDQAPENLRVNLLRNRDAYKNGSGMDRANCEFGSDTGYGGWDFGGYVCQLNAKGAIDVDKDTIQPVKSNYGRKVTPRIRQYLDAQIDDRYRDSRYIHKNGLGKTIKEIVEANLTLPNMANSESCYYLNPPVDPDERRSILEYVQIPSIAIQSTLIRTIDEEVEISDVQQQQLYTSPKTHGNCAQMVKRNFTSQIAGENQAEFSDVAGVPSGTFKSPGTAVRVELNTNDGTRSIYLPIKGFSAAQIGAMFCQTNRIFINYGGGLKEYVVLEYDQNARLLRKWQIALPPELKEWHRLAELSVDKDRINIKLVDFESSGYNQGKKVPAKIHKQYFLEAKL